AALVEEATAAARSMEDQANQLATAVSMFRTTTCRGTPPARPVLKVVAPARPQPPAPARPRPAPPADGGNWREF
ncbi:methyl-accepting chemotaxis protein, partial [Stenotrophomonas acidaminiphila]